MRAMSAKRHWASGKINWLLDVIAPNAQLATAVVTNFRQVTNDNKLRIHPVVSKLIDPELRCQCIYFEILFFPSPPAPALAPLLQQWGAARICCEALDEGRLSSRAAPQYRHCHDPRLSGRSAPLCQRSGTLSASAQLASGHAGHANAPGLTRRGVKPTRFARTRLHA